MADIRQVPYCDVAVGHLDRFAPAALAHTIDGGTFEHVQVAPGAFDGQLLRIHLEDRVFNQGRYNLPVLARGNLSERRVTLGYAEFTTGTINGEVVGGPFVFLYTEAAELDVRIPAWGRWVAVQFSREELDALGVSVPRYHAGVVPTTADGVTQFARALAEWDPRLAELGEAQGSGMQKATLLGALFEQLDMAFCGVMCAGRGQLIGGAGADYRVVRAAREFMQASLAEPLRVSDLCRACGVSYKTLERHFARQTGVGPRRYLELARLTRARAMLQAEALGGLRVADIAMHCGFAHLGRFSVDYRRHYGESPARTRIAGIGAGRATQSSPAWPPAVTAAHSSPIASRK